MEDCLRARTPGDLTEAKKEWIEKYKEKWKSEITNKPKLRSYQNWKKEYETEKYIALNLSRQERSFIAQFRGGVLPIRIETGRFQRIPVEDRICELCGQEVEDEKHYTLRCECLEETR